ncbi:hypothetical protein E3E22_08015 [Thermococcus sp. MV5]|uniref:hypothetical protein n=2 Tax=unclassified Thermococcus TaxID=2627626 RepID=UPI001438C046|nr:hypothetical protein [Thermococcus sp. MV5]NJE26559.1 hypothetical protein [Thermococcus sp. MV5]
MVLSLFLSSLRLMFVLPKILWQFAGMKRAINKGKRKFRKSLIKNGIPKELAEELVKDYAVVDELLNIKGLLRIAKTTTSWHTEHNMPKPPKAR